MFGPRTLILSLIFLADCVSHIKACLLDEASLSLFNRCSVENFIRLYVVGQHLIELVVDLLMQVQELRVSDVEDPLGVLLAQHFLYLLV